MLNKILAAFHLDDPASLKRALATLFSGVAVLGINPLLAAHQIPPVSDVTLGGFAAIAAAYLAQSGANSVAEKLAAAKAAGDAAAAGVTDDVAAAAGVGAAKP